jgi:hypothetical protein
MSGPHVPDDIDAVDEVPAADAAEQHAEIVEPAVIDESGEIDAPPTPHDEIPRDDDDRVVILDDDEYR